MWFQRVFVRLTKPPSCSKPLNALSVSCIIKYLIKGGVLDNTPAYKEDQWRPLYMKPPTLSTEIEAHVAIFFLQLFAYKGLSISWFQKCGLEFDICQTMLWNQFFLVESLTLIKMDRFTITQRIKMIKTDYKIGNSATTAYHYLRGDYDLHKKREQERCERKEVEMRRCRNDARKFY